MILPTGTPDASGQNIYVSRDGKIRTIHRFDLNDDGYVDVLFGTSHDSYTYIPATLATVSSDRAVRTSELTVEGSLTVDYAGL